MGNTLITPTIIAKEALIALENNMVLGNLVYRGYSPEYTGIGSTVTIRKPASFTSTAFTSTIIVQDITESSITAVLDTHLDVSFEVTTQELSLNIVDFSEQTIQPAMRAHAQRVDELLAARFVDIAAHQAVSATPAVSDIAGIRKVLNVNKAPMEDRYCVMHPSTEVGYIVLDAFLHAEKRGDTKALREGSMGRVMGMDFYMDQNIATHTRTATAAGSTGVVLAALGPAAATVVINGLTNAQKITVGDVFTVQGCADEWFKVSTAATAGTGTFATVVFTPPISSKGTFAASSTVTFQDTHKANLAFHKNAIALVTAPLSAPLGGANAAVETYKGISCRVVYDYSTTYKKNIVSIDLLLGTKTLDMGLACRLADAR